MAAPRQASTVTFLGLPGVPQLGLGLAALGRPGYINLGHGSDLQHKAVDDMRAHCWGVLDAAWAAGIRCGPLCYLCQLQCHRQRSFVEVMRAHCWQVMDATWAAGTRCAAMCGVGCLIVDMCC